MERFEPQELAELQLAEQLAPWGEAAANLRMIYQGLMMQAIQCADDEDRRQLLTSAWSIMEQLQGPESEPGRPLWEELFGG